MHASENRPDQTVGQIGEMALIRRIAHWLGPTNPLEPEGIGDDCAVFQVEAGLPQLVTTDPVIARYHFDASVAPEWVGAKLLKRNISDIAAMGGRPRRAVLSLALPSATALDWLERFFRGLRESAEEYGVRVVGGDVAQTDGPAAAYLTLLGDAPAGRALTRRGARAGDPLFVTGELGGSLAEHHYRFRPRVEEGVWLAGRPEVRAMIDVSDGLAKDLPALLPSGCQAALEWDALPVRDSVTTAGDKAAGWCRALTDGEDYELLFAIDGRASIDRFVRDWRASFPCRLTRIGTIETASASGPPGIRLPPGYPELEKLAAYEHFRPGPDG